MKAAAAYVPVRVTNMMGIDLATYRFDYDLTFAVLLLNADGTVYHRYGGRDAASATAWLNMPSLVRLLERGVETHREYAKAPSPPKRERHLLDDVPAWAEKVAERKRANKPLDCYHCHFIYDADWMQEHKDGSWNRERIWRWPPPERVGLTLDREQQERVVSVQADSPAARAGLKAGDLLDRLDGQRILSHMDVSWVLERTPKKGADLPLRTIRDGKARDAVLKLESGWRRGTPLEFSWRPSKWRLQPRPGFGGRDLRVEEKRALGLAPDAFAFKVGYIVTWGPMPRYGRKARQAGIRKGDVVLRVGDAELTGSQHFHAWWRLTRKPGETVEIETLRGGKRRTVTLTVID